MSLSIRIFLWFWVSVLLVAVVTFVWSRSDFWSPVPLSDNQQKYVDTQMERLQVSWSKRERRNQPMHAPWLDRRGDKGGSVWWLLEPDTGDFLNHRVPKPLKDQVEEVLDYGEPVLFRAGPHWIIGPVHLELGGQERILFLGLPLKMTNNLHWKLLLRSSPVLLAGIVLVLAIISYLVARQIAGPLESLRQMAERIAGGDFKAKLEPKLLNRSDEIGSLARTASQMGQSIDEALQAHKRLLSDVSHELRSPLTRLSLANTLMTKWIGIQAENGRIEHEVEQLNGMIEQLLSLSRMQLTPEQERVPVAVLPVVKRCVADAEFSFPDLSIRLDNQLLDSQEPWVKGSEELLSRALQNVLNNASRYCKQQIKLTLQEQDCDWLIRIEDDGEGVPEAELSKLFVPFYRPEFARQRDKGGTGLGLAIVEQAIDFHCGQVQAEISELGGLAIVMRLPKHASIDG